MAQYNVQFSIDGRRTQEIVSAYNTNDARKIIEARYTGAKDRYMECNKALICSVDQGQSVKHSALA